MAGRSSHFRAAWEDQDDPSPLPDDRDVHTVVAVGTNQGGTASLPSPLNARGGGFLFVRPAAAHRHRTVLQWPFGIPFFVWRKKEMKPYGVNELREMFLKFFESKGHLRLPSFSLILSLIHI